VAEAVSPSPPVADVSMPWDATVPDPVAALGAARAELGDTFLVPGADTTYLFLLSPAGVRAFYGLDETDASKGVADWRMLRRKLPDELFVGRRTFPHDLFARDDVVRYRDVVAATIDDELDALGEDGTVDVFAFTRRLGHRIGLATWAGPCGRPGAVLDELVTALDVLDGAAAFVDPGAMAAVAAAEKRAERDALARCEAIVGATVATPGAGHFAEIVGRWADESDDAARRIGIARDVVLVHLGSMSNLFAALGWMLLDVAARPHLVEAVRAGDRDLAERCALESIRIAQRSIMLRYALRPCRVADEDHEYDVAPGTTIATLVPLTNCPVGLGDYDPGHWSRRRLKPELVPEARELVTTFGHGAHTCPAQPYSLHVMVSTLVAALDRFDLEVLDPDARPRAAQIGGIARPAGPCRIRHSRR
jgi:cytochrome P450